MEEGSSRQRKTMAAASTAAPDSNSSHSIHASREQHILTLSTQPLLVGYAEYDIAPQHEHHFSSVKFCNKTERRVDLIGITYEYEGLLYRTISPRGREYMKTYVTHLWIAREQNTGEMILLNGEEVYMPQSSQPEREGDNEGEGYDDEDSGEEIKKFTVHLHLPVYSLRRRCIQVVRQFISRRDVPQLELPLELKEDLLQQLPHSYDDVAPH